MTNFKVWPFSVLPGFYFLMLLLCIYIYDEFSLCPIEKKNENEENYLVVSGEVYIRSPDLDNE